MFAMEIADEKDLKTKNLHVSKKGTATGETTGLLHEGTLTFKIDNNYFDGVFTSFKGCYAVKDIETAFCEDGDSGSGVFLKETKNQPKKALGILFANSNSKSFVCDIKKIVELFNLEVYYKKTSVVNMINVFMARLGEKSIIQFFIMMAICFFCLHLLC